MVVTLVLADDHRLVREGIRALLDRAGLTVLADAADGAEAVRLVERFQPDVVVLDVSMPGFDGIAAIREVARVSPRTRPILLTMHRSEVFALLALRSGARGYVWKSQTSEELVDAIRDVCRGDIYLSPDVSSAIVDAYLALAGLAGRELTPREQEIVKLVAEGKTTYEVAMILGLGVQTAKTYRARVMKKLGIHSASGIVRYAVRSGLIQP